MTISIDDFLVFCGRTVDGMRRSLERLDDDTVNALPDLPAPNSPYQIVTHALAACTWWTDHVICANPSDRDRAAEFTARGTIAELEDHATALVSRLHTLAPQLGAATTLAHAARTTIPLGEEWTVGAALLHAYEELAQHLGHLEITVDLVA